MPSNLTAFNFIAEGSEATPGLFNTIFSTLSNNIGTVNILNSTGSFTAPASGTSGVLALNASSALTDYIVFHDTSNQRSNYILGSHIGGTADGLNLWDDSGQTLIATFSKQSIRFYQNVVGPVFDVGGALANTLNAGTFGTGADSKESRIQAAISAATAASIARVYVPANMYPYSSASVSFATSVQMVREGGDWSLYDVQAYGASPTTVADSTSAFSAALFSAGAGVGGVSENPGLPPAGIGGKVYVPNGRYLISSTITVPANCILEGTGRGSTIYMTHNGDGIRVSRPVSDGYSFRVRLREFSLIGNTTGASQIGISIRSAQQVHMENIEVDSMGSHGIYMGDNSVNCYLWNVRSAHHNGLGLFMDALLGGVGVTQNCDSHMIVGGLYHGIRMRDTQFVSMYAPFITGGSSYNTGIQAEGTLDTALYAPYFEQHTCHLALLEHTDGQRNRYFHMQDATMQGGSGNSIQIMLNGDIDTVIRGLHVANTPSLLTSNADVSMFSITSRSINARIESDLGWMGLSDNGVRTQIINPSIAQNLPGSQVGGTNLLKNSNAFASTGWTVGSGVSIQEKVATGPFPWMPASRMTWGSDSFGNISQSATGVGSAGTAYTLSIWLAALSNTQAALKISVPGVGDEVEADVSVGPSWRRYVVKGPRGTQSGTVAATINPPAKAGSNWSILLAGSQLQVGGCTEYIETGASSVTVPVGAAQIAGVTLGSDGSVTTPSWAYTSEQSLGLYRSAASTLALSYGTLNLGNSVVALPLVVGSDAASAGNFEVAGPARSSYLAVFRYTDAAVGNVIMAVQNGGTNTFLVRDSNQVEIPVGPLANAGGTVLQPSYAFLSETSLGLYRSAASTIKQSYGTFWGPEVWASGLSLKASICSNSYVSSSRTLMGGEMWSSGISVGNATAGGTLIPAISSVSSKIGAFVVQGSASSFTLVVWAAAQPGDQIMVTPFGAGVSSLSSGLVAHSHCTKAGQVEMRLSNVSTLAQNQSSISWYLTRISPF